MGSRTRASRRWAADFVPPAGRSPGAPAHSARLHASGWLPATPVSRLRSSGTVPVQRARESSGYWELDFLSFPLLVPSCLPNPAHSYGPFPWSKLRQGQKLLRLAERYTTERLEAACARA